MRMYCSIFNLLFYLFKVATANLLFGEMKSFTSAFCCPHTHCVEFKNTRNEFVNNFEYLVLNISLRTIIVNI